MIQLTKCRPGDKPLSKPMMIGLLTHICVTRPQWVKLCGAWLWLLDMIQKNNVTNGIPGALISSFKLPLWRFHLSWFVPSQYLSLPFVYRTKMCDIFNTINKKSGSLTHWGLSRITAIFAYDNIKCILLILAKIIVFLFKYHLGMTPMIQLTHWGRLTTTYASVN